MANAYITELMHNLRMREQCSQWLSVRRRSHGSRKLLASDLYFDTSWPRSLIWLCVVCSGSMGYDDITIVMRASMAAVWMWSITATHPILRIFHYQYHASLSVLGSCGSHDVDRVQPDRADPVTMPYQLLPRSCMWHDGQLGWFGFGVRRLTNCYQTLPGVWSGSTPPERKVYQPRLRRW